MLKRLAIRFLNALQGKLDLAKDRAIRAALGYCGADVRIRHPVVIEVPQNVFISDNVSIASFLHIWGSGKVTIGRGTMIASHVAITSATHDPDALLMNRTLIARPVVIEDNVWIGAHAVIMPGVVVGANSVVAAGSVVLKDVVPNTVVAGVPAKLVREKDRSEGLV
jgi:acetyltransferase-like isoleucine patch superfamily enzyme